MEETVLEMKYDAKKAPLGMYGGGVASVMLYIFSHLR